MIFEVFDMLRQKLQSQRYCNVSLEEVINLAYSLGAQIEFKDLHKRHPQFDAYTRHKIIYVDKSFEHKRRSLKCILAEEIGHVLYPPVVNHVAYHLADTWDELQYNERDSLELVISRDERFALKYAADLLIPVHAFWEFASYGPHEMHEWLDHFEVKQWLFEYRVGYIRASQPVQWRLKWRDILIRK